MHITFSLRTRRPELKPHTPLPHPRLQRLQTLHPDVLQTMLDPRHQVGQELRHTPPIKHGAGNALRHEEFVAFAEIARRARVGGRRSRLTSRRGSRFGRRGRGSSLLILHSVNRAHTTIRLAQLPIRTNNIRAGGLGRSSQQPTHHNGASTQRQRLDNVAYILDPAVGNTGYPETGRELRDAVDGGSLRPADGHDFLCDAGGSRTHTYPQPVHAGGYQRGGLLAGYYVAADDVEVGVGLLDPPDHLELVLRIALTGIEDDNIEPRVHERREAGFIRLPCPDGRGGEQLLRPRDFGGEGEVQVLHQVAAAEEGDEIACAVDDGELALFRAREYVVGFLEADSFAGGHQVRRHYFCYRGGGVGVELDVARGDDADEFAAEGAVFCSNTYC